MESYITIHLSVQTEFFFSFVPQLKMSRTIVNEIEEKKKQV